MVKSKIPAWIQLLRPYQWIKNGFVLLPVVFSEKLGDLHALGPVFGAFAIFCAASSAVYIANDLADANADKLHPIKKWRPLAQGGFSPTIAMIMAAGLGVSALAFALMLNGKLGVCIAAYILGNLFYSRLLKHVVILDVMSIGFFFLLRVISGAVVISVNVSEWLLICSAILALFLGFNKRRHEIITTGSAADQHRYVLGKYSVYFIDQMIAVLTASTVIFYTLYTVDAHTVARFGTKGLLYTVPFVYYGIFRYLYLVHKRRQGGDPSRIMMKDRMLQLNVILWLAAAISVIYFFK